MTNTEARKVFDQAVIAAKGNADAVAKIELAREYFTNATFRRKMEDHVWRVNRALA